MTLVLRCRPVGPNRLPIRPYPTMPTMRLPANGKYWLKRARIRFDPPAADWPAFSQDAGDDGTVLADLRIEEGRIRAILPAGSAPCCSPGIDLDGGRARGTGGDRALVSGVPADLELSCPADARIILESGIPVVIREV